jgi:DNA-3-methyladenine glycosylase
LLVGQVLELMTRTTRQRDPEMKVLQDLQAALRAGAMAGARALLGCVLERRGPGWVIRARIVETEAYTQDDPASHSFRGRTPRNAPMFDRAGIAYVYTSYGMHRCLNVVTGEEGTGEAVLIRALEPLDGVEQMTRHRRWEGKPAKGLADGPGKLCQALRIGLECNGWDLLAHGDLCLRIGSLKAWETVAVSRRIGITKAVDWPRRFLLAGNRFVSRRG